MLIVRAWFIYTRETHSGEILKMLVDGNSCSLSLSHHHKINFISKTVQTQ